MATVEVFDPPMCCSTGVCGPSVDPALAEFAADLRWLGEHEVSVTRYNLAQQPGPFTEHAGVRELLATGGEDVLPIVVVDGEICSSGRPPARAELEAWALPGDAADVLDELTAELVAIGAAVGASCEPCFKYHYAKARKLGAVPGVITAAVRMAQAVKDAPARSMLELAAKLLGTNPQVLRQVATGTGPAAAGQDERTVSAEATGEAAGLAEAPSPCCDGTAQAEGASRDAAATGEAGCCG